MTQLTLDAFSDLADTTFTIPFSDETIDLVLTEAVPLGSAPRTGGAFSLVFSGPGGPHLLQNTYRMSHGELGELDIFLVPLGPKDGRNLYEAVFT